MSTSSYRIVRSVAWFTALSLVIGSALGCARSKDEAPASGSGSATTFTGGPKIEFDALVHDFGPSAEGDSLRHVFKVYNRGDAPLLIKSVSTSCGCTAAVLKSKEIAPGASGEIQVTFDTRNRAGANKKTITVVSNDAQKAQSVLEVRTEVERLLALQPFSLRLSMNHGEQKTAEAWFSGKLANQVKPTINKIENGDGAQIELIEKKEGETTVHGLRLKIQADKIGSGSGRVIVDTGVDKVAQLTIPFGYTVLGNVRVTPARVFFDATSPAGKERRLYVTSRLEDFKVQQVKVTKGPYTAELQTADAGTKRFEVLLRATDAAKDGDGDGVLLITSNDPLEPRVEVPLGKRTLPRIPRPTPSTLRIPAGFPSK